MKGTSHPKDGRRPTETVTMTTESRGRVRIEPTTKRLRAFLGHTAVFDTVKAVLVWEGPHFPVYYVPAADVTEGALVPSDRTERSPSRGVARFWSVRGGDRVAQDAARQYPASPFEPLRDLVRFEWDAMDSWFEEDEQVFTHARDPHHRIDILRSSRHVEVIVSGVVVADSRRPTLLFETGMLTRYYLPLTDVRTDLLRSSSTATSCPYKGSASYWSLDVEGERLDDVVWTYPSPLAESARIAGLACFYNERLDIRVDGVLQERRLPALPGLATAA
jgi:uncharacterized protein (DUF427 family)